MNLELDDNEKPALIELLVDTIERDRFPLSPRVRRLRGILAKLGVGSAPPMPSQTFGGVPEKPRLQRAFSRS